MSKKTWSMMHSPHITLLLISFVAGFTMMWIQGRHLKNPFLSPAQFQLTSVLGLLSFGLAVFVAVKGLFP